MREGQEAGASMLLAGACLAASGSEGSHVGERMGCSGICQQICGIQAVKQSDPDIEAWTSKQWLEHRVHNNTNSCEES